MSVDLHHTTKAVARWLKDDTMRFLTKGDPKTKSITLSAAFDAEAAIFELAVPVKLKGLDTGTKAILRIYASTIASLELSKNPTTIPSGIKDEVGSTALGLDFTLNDPPAIIVPSCAPEPLSATRKHSRDILDTIRDLSKATALSIYIEACNAPDELQDICDAVSQGLFTPCNIQHHIASMYGGNGGKRIDLSVAALPPSYDEAAMSPPPPPPIDRGSKKRARQDSDPERDDITLLWAELRTLKQIPGRVETLEAEIEELRQKNTNLEEKYEKAEQRNTQLQAKYDALESRFEEVESTNEAFADIREKYKELETRFAQVESSDAAFADTYDLQLTDLREDMTALGNIVQCVQDGQTTDESLEVIQKVVIKEMLRRLADGIKLEVHWLAAYLFPLSQPSQSPCRRRTQAYPPILIAIVPQGYDQRSPTPPFVDSDTVQWKHHCSSCRASKLLGDCHR
ncbi:hypothetical protein FLAG1_10146 [Fusarium langsethiae]|uniref:Uncharacterized protein n=1 Tax=Fusarium langsethiae TaxID=179993 RepID=A0A0M9EP79_FUSLA|nr:hypothetical protein FLAG1_10146 [Fusarium langsethiae]GKU07304.1 unnamed protein product [Fusarium langsethiae]